VQDHLEVLERIRADIADSVARFNARDVDGFLAKHAEDVKFAIPMLGGPHDAEATWGCGRAAFRDYVLMGFERQGTLAIIDVVSGAGGSSISVLMEDSYGLRTETCLEYGTDGLVTRVFAFPLGQVRSGLA
jgi:hypothetical protein